MAPQSGKTTLVTLLDMVESSPIGSIKGTVCGILSIINDPRSSPADLKELIGVDPPLSAKILRVANSPYYASPRSISDIDQAIIWIGFDELKEIILTQQMGQIFSGGKEIVGYSRAILWRHCLAVALLAKMIYRREFGLKGNNAYAAGLIHDIGVIIEDQLVYAEFEQLLMEIQSSHRPLTDVENDVWGYDHGAVGKAIAEHWNFPTELTAGIGFHHNPSKAPAEYRDFAKTIFIADYLMFLHGFGYVEMELPSRDVFQQYAEDLGLHPYALETLVESLREEMKIYEEKGYLSV